MQRPARILMIVENNPYPFDVRVRREAQALRDAGYEVSVIAPKGAGQRWQEVMDDITVYRFPRPPSGSGILSYAIEYAYATTAIVLMSACIAAIRGVSVMHAANPPDTLFIAAALLKIFGVKFVFDHHDLSPETYLSRFGKPKSCGGLPHKILLLLEKWTFALADIVIATNESYRSNAVRRGGKSPSKVFVVRNGPPRTLKARQPDADLRGRANILIGYIGTMGPQDGVDYWLRAIKTLTEQLDRKDILAVVIGDGDALPGLRMLARELNIERHVMFTGRVSDEEVQSILSTVDLCVQPDPSNPLNDCSTMNKVMEYMVFAKPIVAFDLPETRVSARDAAIYATDNNVAEFAAKVLWLIERPAERLRMGEAGRRRVLQELAWEHSVPNLLGAYDALLGAPELRTAVKDNLQ
jgi:glycosyltransferase involved in cell wall biosynthesis